MRSIRTRKSAQLSANIGMLKEDITTTPIKIDNYKARLLKLIPTEIIAAYIAIDNILKGNQATLQTSNLYEVITWVIFGILFILTPFYLKKYMNVSSTIQLTLSTIAFAVWVLSMGGPFLFLLGSLTYIIGSIVLILYTTIVPIFYK